MSEWVSDLWANPVISWESEYGENLYPPAVTQPHNPSQRLNTGHVTRRCRQPPHLRPPPISVHNHRHVLRHQLRPQLWRNRLRFRFFSKRHVWRSNAAFGNTNFHGPGKILVCMGMGIRIRIRIMRIIIRRESGISNNSSCLWSVLEWNNRES